jgi:hypothetical protein
MTLQFFVRLTQNERAACTFRTVVLPILDALTGNLPKDLACEEIDSDISYHMHIRERRYDEGKEILVVVLDRIDAWVLSSATMDSTRQDILNRNKIYVSGTDFGLSLTKRDPLNVQALPRSIPAKPDATSTARSSTLVARSPLLESNQSPPAVSLPALVAPAY